MRSSKIAALAFALVLAGASAGLAQQAPHQHPQDGTQKQEMKRHKQRGGFGMLLKGIELTEAQRTQLKALRTRRADTGRDAELKAARERGDTAALRKFRTERAVEMKQRHEKMLSGVRAILTPAQREVFDRNAAEAKKRFQGGRAQRQERRS